MADPFLHLLLVLFRIEYLRGLVSGTVAMSAGGHNVMGLVGAAISFGMKMFTRALQ